MSYQVLARKWRPKSFQTLMGQEHVVTVLVNALSQQRLHHAYLFTGTRGVGKTTIARIFAKSLNCLEGITATPCGKCDACLDIDQGRFVDLLEIDAASRTKVDDTREILDNVQYAPTRGRYKVYLIDEVHMLSRSSFNALLKTLEEPPEHVKFILATTDPQKLPVTVLSRCLQFHLKALTVQQIESQLSEILSAEKVSHQAGSLTLLAKAARGSMRDALSLTDQSIAQGQGEITVENVQQMLGGVDQNWVYKILILLIKHDAANLMLLSQEIASYAPSYSKLMAELIQLLHQVAMAQVIGNQFDLPEYQKTLLDKFTQALSPEDVQLYYQIAFNGRKDLPYAGDEQAAFDMVLLRLLSFKPVQNFQSLVQQDKDNSLSEAVNFEHDVLPDTAVSGQQTQIIAKPDEQLENISNSKNLDDADNAQRSSLAEEQGNVTESAESLTQQMLAVEQLAAEQRPVELVLDEQVSDGPSLTGQIADEKILTDQEVDSVKQQTDIDSSIPLSAVENISYDVSENGLEHTTVSSDDMFAQTYTAPEIEHTDAQVAEQTDVTEPAVQDQVQQEQMQNMQAQPEQSTAPDEAQYNQAQTQHQSNEGAIPVDYASPVDAVLATRNMLRSRKKQLESGSKKSSDANERQDNNVTAIADESATTENLPASKPVKNEAPAIETVPEQPYSPEIIDPTSIRYANQVDKWANMIDTMALNGRIRQLAIHATISENSNDDLLILNLDQSTKHLKSEAAHQQLQSFISDYLQKPITVEINVVEQTISDPYQIQTDINDKRLDYAISVIKEDEIVQTLQQQYQAELDEKSIVAR